MPALPQLVWLDWALLAVLLVSTLVGLMRGLLFEVMSLLGWLVAYGAAQAGAPLLAPHLGVGAPGSALNLGAAFALAFVLALLAWALLARLLRMLVRATPLTVIDRALGMLFGALRGVVLLLALATVVALTPLARSPAWQQARGAAWLGHSLAVLKQLLPAETARHLQLSLSASLAGPARHC